MRVHFDERKSTVRLHSRLCYITKVRKERDEIVLSRVGGQVSYVTSGLPGRGLAHDHIVALDTVRGEVVVSIGSRGCHSHGSHGLLLGDRGLSLLVRPVAANGSRTEPLSVHGTQGLLGISTVAESNESVAARTTGLHVPHNTGLGDGAERGESLKEDFIVDFVGEIANKDVKVARRILLAGRV